MRPEVKWGYFALASPILGATLFVLGFLPLWLALAVAIGGPILAYFRVLSWKEARRLFFLELGREAPLSAGDKEWIAQQARHIQEVIVKAAELYLWSYRYETEADWEECYNSLELKIRLAARFWFRVKSCAEYIGAVNNRTSGTVDVPAKAAV